jgi:hypothetical protein
MSTKITNLTNHRGETTGTVLFDEASHSWRIASKAEPTFHRTFRTSKMRFISGMPGFDPETGKLRHFPPENKLRQGAA